MQIETRGMKRGLNEEEFRNALNVLELTEREERHILRQSEVLNLLFANHQCCYLNHYFQFTLKKTIPYNKYAIMFNVNVKTIRRWITNGPMDPKPLGRHAALDDEIENQLIRMLIEKSDNSQGLTQRELLNFINENYNKILTRGWVNNFLLRHSDEIKSVRSFPQEDQRMLIPREFLKEHLLNLYKIFHKRVAELVFNLDELGYSEWQSRSPKKVIVSSSTDPSNVYHSVKRSLAHMSLLVCISLAGDSLTPMLITKYSISEKIFEDGLRQDEDVSLRQRDPPYISSELFQEFIELTFITYVQEVREKLNMKKEPAILMMDSCRAHCSENVLELLGKNNIIVYTFPSHTSNLFQPCDLSLFGTLKIIQKSLKHEESQDKIKYYVMRILKAYESAATSFNIRSSFRKSGLFICTTHKPYTIDYDSVTLKKNPGFQILWNLNIKKEELSARRINQKFGVINMDYLPRGCPIFINELDESRVQKILEGLKK